MKTRNLFVMKFLLSINYAWAWVSIHCLIKKTFQINQPEDTIDAGGAIIDLVFDKNHQKGDLGGFLTPEFKDLR